MKKLFLLPIFCFFTLLSCNSEPQSFEELTSSIEEFLGNEEGTYSVVFKDLNNPDNEFYMNADTLFHAASTMKTPVMIEVFKRIEAGEFSIDDSITIKNEFTSIVDGSTFQIDIQEDSDDPIEHMVGEKVSLFDLVHAMITYSSNIATNIVIELVGAEETTQTMRDMGAENIQVVRGLYDMKAFNQGLSNRTTARDLAVIFENLAQHKYLTVESNEMMIDILTDQYYRDVIPQNLPEDLIIANKTGFITGVRHDSAVVYLPDGRSYILIFLSKELPDEDRGRENGATVSEMIYNFYVAN